MTRKMTSSLQLFIVSHVDPMFKRERLYVIWKDATTKSRVKLRLPHASKRKLTMKECFVTSTIQRKEPIVKGNFTLA